MKQSFFAFPFLLEKDSPGKCLKETQGLDNKHVGNGSYTFSSHTIQTITLQSLNS